MITSKKKLAFLFILLLSLGLVSCDDDDDATPALQIPSAYDASGFSANAAAQVTITNNLSTLTNEIKAGRDGSAVAAADLTAALSPLQPLTTAEYGTYVAGLIPEIVAASGNTFDVDNAPSGDGGVLGGYLFDENALELEQMVEKGMFGATLYFQARQLLDGTITPATIDQVLALYGTTPDFPNNGSDGFLAKYAARRTPASGGLYTNIQANFIKAQAAAQNPTEFATELNEAIADIILDWEKANAATVINYCQAAISKLSSSDLNNDDFGSAMHSYSEGVAFLTGWYHLPNNYKLITNAQIEEALVFMEAPLGQTPTSYKFITENSPSQLAKLQSAIDLLQGVYGFTDTEIEGFKNNWVTLEGR